MTWRDLLPIHPAAELFPPMSGEELRELSDDIVRHGLRTPVTLWSNSDDDELHEALLDGRNRLDAAEQAGLLSVDDHGELRLRHPSGDYIPIPKSYSRDDDPYDVVLSANLHRRHLTAEQRRELIAKVIRAAPEKSNRRIADQVKASHPTVAKIRNELKEKGDVESIYHVDTKGRQQPARKHSSRYGSRSRPKTKSLVLAEAMVSQAAQAAADLTLAIDTCAPRMTTKDLKAACRRLDAVCKQRERADSARATSEQLRFYP